MRQNIRPNPSEKIFEAYMDFSGGLNSETSNEKLKDNEFPLMQNVDLSGRGSAKRRTGRTSLVSQAGTAQGMNFFYRLGQTEPDLILAISGKLYVKQAGSSTISQINITDSGSAFTFQTTLPVEGVQYGTSMFWATGTKLVEVTYSGSAWSAVTVTPYTPTVMEAIYIGTNGLASNPDSYVQDGVDTVLTAVGIKPNKRTATVNQNMSMTAYINKPASITSVDYKWEYKKSAETTYTLGRDWTNGTTGKSYNFNVTSAGTYDIKVTVRDNANQTNTNTYVLSSYIVNQVEDKSNTDLPVTGIQKCRKILLHWDRILLSLDDTNPYQMYVSDLNNPRYFPVTNTIKFDTGKQEPITSVIRYQDMLVVFTKTTIQTLTGKSTDDYSRYLIHDGIGCVAGRSAQVVGNDIIFLSDEGIMKLKPNYFKLEMMNVQRIDFPIKSELPKDSDACSLVYDSQYWICFPQKSIVYRLYYDNAMWVKDVSTKLNFNQFAHYGDKVYNLTTAGNIYIHDKTVHSDCGEVFEMPVESKYLDLGSSFNFKKLKKIHVLLGTTGAKFYVTITADNQVALSPEAGQVVKDENGYTTWQVTSTPNLEAGDQGSIFGQWELGQSTFGADAKLSGHKISITNTSKSRRIKVKFIHQEDKACEIFGFGLEFRLKKP